ncbi:MAG: MaoC family dehydratase, partial [Candidatus Dormibacteraceae bacterium]
MAPHPVPNPLFFEDLPLGGEWTTRGRTITAADLHAYMALAGDFHPLYADAAYASRDGRAGIVAPAALIAAVALGLGAMDLPLPSTTALVGMEWRYLAPVHPGDTLHADWRLGRKRPVDEPDVGLAIWQIEVRNQQDLVVAEGEVARLVARRHHRVPVETSLVTEPEPEPSAEPLAVTAGSNAERATPRRRRRRGGTGSTVPGTAPAPAPVEAAVAEPPA